MTFLMKAVLCTFLWIIATKGRVIVNWWSDCMKGEQRRAGKQCKDSLIIARNFSWKFMGCIVRRMKLIGFELIIS